MEDFSDEDDDEELDLFGEATDEEKAARQKVIDEAKKRGEAKAKLTKSMIVLDVKPWDDTTGQALGLALRHSRLCCTCAVGGRVLIWGLLRRPEGDGGGGPCDQEGWPFMGRK